MNDNHTRGLWAVFLLTASAAVGVGAAMTPLWLGVLLKKDASNSATVVSGISQNRPAPPTSVSKILQPDSPRP